MASGRHETFELPRVAEEPLTVAGIPIMLEQMFDDVKRCLPEGYRVYYWVY
jgi:hypothetical protein